jgi:hypothetical protein
VRSAQTRLPAPGLANAGTTAAGLLPLLTKKDQLLAPQFEPKMDPIEPNGGAIELNGDVGKKALAAGQNDCYAQCWDFNSNQGAR